MELSFLVMMLAVMTGPEDGVLNFSEYGGVEGMEGDASGKKYGESDVEGVDDGDCAGKLGGLFWFCRLGRVDEGVCGAMKQL